MDNTVTLNHKEITEIIMWANDEFGDDAYKLDSQFPIWSWTFKFKDRKDAMLFALKWI